MTWKTVKYRQGSSHPFTRKIFEDNTLNFQDFVFKDISEAIRTCRKHAKQKIATKLYTFICGNGLETDAKLGNFLVPMLVDCERLLNAQQVFLKLTDRNEHSWTSLMQGYLDQGDSLHTCELFQKMQDDSIRPSKYSVQVLLKACLRLAFVEGIHISHSYFVENCFEADICVGNALVHTYANRGLLSEAINIFNGLAVQDVVSWTSLIIGYAEQEFTTHSLNCWEQMQVQGVSPNAFTAAATLAVCIDIKDLQKGCELHSFVVIQGFEMDSFIGNTLIDFYGKCGCLSEARSVFNNLAVKDEITWATLMTGYTKHGYIKETQDCLKEMKEMRIATNVVLWNALITEFGELGLIDEVHMCINLMKEEGLHPDAITFTIYAKVCRDARCLSNGKLAHMEVEKLGYGSDNFVAEALVDMYCKSGSFAEAEYLFGKLQAQNTQKITAWTILIAGYCEHGFLKAAEDCLEEMRGEGLSIVVTIWNVVMAAYLEEGLIDEALNCFERMQPEWVIPNAGTYINVLKAWTAKASTSRGQWIHVQITKEGLEQDLFVGTCLIDLYAKCGTLVEVENIFENLSTRDKVTWSAFIAVLADRRLVFSCFDALLAMQVDGVSPSADAFGHCLKACSDSGDLTWGHHVYFQILGQGLENDLSLSSTLICMFSKNGLPEEADYVFKSVDTKDLSLWNSIISGHAAQGHQTKVNELLFEMQQCSVFPGASTYACTLKRCQGNIDLASCQQIHQEIVKDGFEGDLSISNCLIAIYLRHHLFEEAQDVFAEMPWHDALSWTTVISGYAQCMLNEEALRFFKLMNQERLCPEHDTYVWSLKACGSAGDVGCGYDMHLEILKRGLDRVSFVGNSLVEMYTRFGYLSAARQVFDKLVIQNLISWNTIVTGCVENGLHIEALDFAKRLMANCLFIDGITVTGILKACVHSGSLHMGQIIHAEVAKRGLDDVPAVGSSLVEMYVKSGLVNDGWETFRKSLAKDKHLWTVLVSGYASQGNSEAAFGVCKKMKDTGILPDLVTLLSLLTVCAHVGLFNEAQDLCNCSIKEGVVTNLEYYNCIVDLLARAGQLIEATEVIKWLPLQPNVTSWLAILGACRKWGGEDVGKLAFCHADELAGNRAAPHILLFSLSANID